jgi:hypothetical protein
MSQPGGIFVRHSLRTLWMDAHPPKTSRMRISAPRLFPARHAFRISALRTMTALTVYDGGMTVNVCVSGERSDGEPEEDVPAS